jgi:NAD(P)H-quinone oxidoreductase subunit 4
MVFLGFATSNFYATAFKTPIIMMAAVGIVLSAIYSLANLRQIFFGSANGQGFIDKNSSDLRPREGFIAACLLLLILGIGLYPKLATDVFETKVAAMGGHQTQVIASLSQELRSR